MKKLLYLLVFGLGLLATSLYGAGLVVAAPAADSVTINTTITKPTDTNASNDQISISIKQGSSVKDTKKPVQSAATGNKVQFSPLIFSGYEPGQYEVCISATSNCQTFTKTAEAAAVNFSTTITPIQASSSADNTTQTCESATESFGWILCPGMRMIQKTVTGIEQSVIIPFLKTQPLSVNNPDGSMNPLYSLWQVSRTLANALFILVFLVIIFAQTTSFGIDTYTIKRTLPRLVAAAIFVQLSFLISSIGIDIANILGAGIGGLVDSTLKASGITEIGFSGLSAGIGIGALVVGVFAIAGSLLTGAFLLLLIGAFFGVLGVFLTLVARQIIIALLVILSPLAFVLWVLPNTQNLFDGWRKNFVKILLMYPLIVLLFSASKIVAVAATASGNGFSNEVAGLIALAAAIIPLFLIPATFKFAGSMMVTANDWANKYVRDPLKNKAESSKGYENLKDWSDNRKKTLAAGQGLSVGVDTPFGSFKKEGVGRNAFGRMAGGGVTNVGTAARTRGLQDMGRLRASTLKEMEEAGLNIDGFKMVSRGRGVADAMIADARTELGRVKANQAAGLASSNDVALAEQKLHELDAAKQIAQKYYGNIAARSASAIKLGGEGMIEDADRVALHEHAKRGGKVTEQYGQLVWQEARFKNIGSDPATAFTNLAGVTDIGAVAGQINSRPPEKIAAITKSGWDNIAKIGALDKLDDKTIKIATSGRNQTSPAGVKIIEKYEEARKVLSQGAGPQGTFIAKYNTGGKFELLKDKALLGGLIADGSSDTPNEKALRQAVLHELNHISTKADYAHVIEAKTPNEVKEEDFINFSDYKKYWMSRVNPDGSKKK